MFKLKAYYLIISYLGACKTLAFAGNRHSEYGDQGYSFSSWNLIYNFCRKGGLKQAYVIFHTKAVIYKNKLN